MNCKPGDVAVLVDSSFKENIGGFVNVVRLRSGVIWVIEALTPMKTDGGLRDRGFLGLCDDNNLRPIRDQPGTDETLIWAPVPKEKVNA